MRILRDIRRVHQRPGAQRGGDQPFAIQPQGRGGLDLIHTRAGQPRNIPRLVIQQHHPAVGLVKFLYDSVRNLLAEFRHAGRVQQERCGMIQHVQFKRVAF